ncbi:gamma-tubulin complex component 4 isoform X2 [Lycorma delicatula]
MLHEVILALHGCLSSILNKNTHAIELTKVLHPSEKALLKRILNLGETYGHLQNFIDENLCPHIEFEPVDISIDEGNFITGGMYLQAFCDGLQKVLQPYRNDVVLLEKMVVQDPFLSLTSINSHIGGYSQLLCTLHSMITEIKENQIRGCKLLQFVCRHLYTGVESMKDAISEITKCCHCVLINQLTNWLLHGEIMDQYGEFFIKPNKIPLLISKSSGATLGNIDNENTVDERNSTVTSLVQIDGGEFILNEEFIPPYVTFTTASKILYIGKTVTLFKGDLQGKPDFGSKTDVFHQEELYLVKSLQSCSFQDTQRLETIITNLESAVTRRLWLLAMEQANLLGSLKAMKDFYLLGRGELYVDFLNKLGPVLNKQLSSNVCRDLNIGLIGSARNVQYTDETILEKFEFKLPSKDSCSPGVKVKSVLRMEYSPSVPLHLFFSPVVIDNYNVLFRFFLRVKQAQLNLHSIWMKDVKNKKQLLIDGGWQLRNNLMFLVENLQCYLQWDVVESEHTLLMNELKRTQDFEKIRHLHHRFLYDVLSQAFLIPNDAKFDQSTGLLLSSVTSQTTKPHKANVFLCHILDLSEAFCQLVTRSDNVNISDELETMSEKLSHCVTVLVRLITNLRDQISGVHLSKLLLRLDYNHYFSRNHATTI